MVVAGGHGVCQRAGRPGRVEPRSSGVRRGGPGGFLQEGKNLTGKCEEMRGQGPPTLAGTPVAGTLRRLEMGRREGSQVETALGKARDRGKAPERDGCRAVPL